MSRYRTEFSIALVFVGAVALALLTYGVFNADRLGAYLPANMTVALVYFAFFGLISIAAGVTCLATKRTPKTARTIFAIAYAGLYAVVIVRSPEQWSNFVFLPGLALAFALPEPANAF